MFGSKKVTVFVSPSLPDPIRDIEASRDVDQSFSRQISKTFASQSGFLDERVDLSLLASENVITYDLFLQFTSPRDQLSRISQEYYNFRHEIINWKCEYFLALVALVHYLVVGNIQETFFLDKSNCVFLLSFLCALITTTFAILSRFNSFFWRILDQVEVKWLHLYLGIKMSSVQLYECCVFYFSVLTCNLNLLARVLGGRCTNVNPFQSFRPWYLQNCNPMHEVRTIIAISNPLYSDIRILIFLNRS